MKPLVNIFTDGSFVDPRGGWCSLLSCGYHKSMLFGCADESTNNRMELFSVIAALSQLLVPCCVNVYSDSRYVVDAVSKGWITTWIKNGWKTARNKPVENQDLWFMLLPYLDIHEVRFHWVKSHNGHHENEICDAVARSEAKGF